MRSIDIVSENSHVQFPENVAYNFVYWRHEADNINSALDAVADCDIVAYELATYQDFSETDSQVEAGQRFQDFLNIALERGDKEPRVIEWLQQIEAQEPDFPSSFALRYAGSGKKIYLIDAWIHSDDPNHVTQTESGNARPKLWDKPEDILRIDTDHALQMAARESLALSQLAGIGNLNTPQPGEDDLKVSVVYGSHHSLLSIAMKDLGAQVNRQFIDGPMHLSADTMLTRAARATDASPEKLQDMSVAIYVARAALLKYMEIDFIDPSPILESYSAKSDNVKVDTILSRALLNPETASEITPVIIEYITSQPSKGMFEARKQRKRQEVFVGLIQKFIQSSERMSESSRRQ